MSEILTHKAVIKVIYSFEFDSDKKTRKELEEQARDIWKQYSNFGLEGEKYHDTEIDIFIP